MSYSECPACSCKKSKATNLIGVVECAKCGAVYGDCYLGESFEIVRPAWVEVEPPPERTRYFDLTTLGSKGIERRHGWFDTLTKRIVQVG